MSGAFCADHYFDFAVTLRASPFIGILFLVDINPPVNMATLKKNTQKFIGRFHIRARPEFAPELPGTGHGCRNRTKRSVARFPTAGGLQ